MRYTLLLDADSLCYAACCVAQTNMHLVLGADGKTRGPYARATQCALQDGDTVFTSVVKKDFGIAVSAFTGKLRAILEETQAKFGQVNLKVYLTGKGNFRERLPARRQYKHNRVSLTRPVYLAKLMDHVQQQYGAELVHWLEADDAIAIAASAVPDETIVCSIDKDLKQVPGIHCVPGTGFMRITKRGALVNLYTQIIAGDATDGVSGCYRVGVEGARKLLARATTEDEMWEIAVAAYTKSLKQHGEKCGYTDPVVAALETARFVFLLRKKPKHLHSPQLWLPPNERGTS